MSEPVSDPRVARLEEERAAQLAAIEEARAAAAAPDAKRVATVAMGRVRGRLFALMFGGWLVLAIVGAVLFWVRRPAEERLRGQVVSASDQAPVATGDRCTVDVTSEVSPLNGALRVDCRDSEGHVRRLYGHESSGAVLCELHEGRVSRCEDPRSIDQDGDPALLLDRGASRLTVSDGQRWRTEIALEP